jgi:hypothetical protein
MGQASLVSWDYNTIDHQAASDIESATLRYDLKSSKIEVRSGIGMQRFFGRRAWEFVDFVNAHFQHSPANIKALKSVTLLSLFD